MLRVGTRIEHKLFSPTFHAPPRDITTKIPGYPAKKFGFPGFRRTYRTFWPRTLHVEHPSRRYPDSKVWVSVPFSCLLSRDFRIVCIARFLPRFRIVDSVPLLRARKRQKFRGEKHKAELNRSKVEPQKIDSELQSESNILSMLSRNLRRIARV